MLYSIKFARRIFDPNVVVDRWFIVCRLVDVPWSCSCESASCDAEVINGLMLSQFIIKSDSLIEH